MSAFNLDFQYKINIFLEMFQTNQILCQPENEKAENLSKDYVRTTDEVNYSPISAKALTHRPSHQLKIFNETCFRNRWCKAFYCQIHHQRL